MLTILTVVTTAFRLALAFVLNSLKIAVHSGKLTYKTGKGAKKAVSRAKNKLGGRAGKTGKAGKAKKAAKWASEKAIQASILVITSIIRFLDFLIAVLFSLWGIVAGVVAVLVIALIVASVSPFMFLEAEDGGWDMVGKTQGVHITQDDGDSTGRESGDWDFEVVEWDEVTNIPDWVNKPAYMEGLKEETKYVVRVLNGAFPDEYIMSLYRRGDSDSSHGQGKGVDISAEGEKGWKIANWLAENHEKLKITELIYQSRYFSSKEPEKGFQTGVLTIHGDKTLDHYDHVHISVNY